jgi:hypothetical protein
VGTKVSCGVNDSTRHNTGLQSISITAGDAAGFASSS